MQSAVKHFLLFSIVIWLIIGLCPLLFVYCLPETHTTAPSVPNVSPAPATPTAFRIFNESDGTVLTVEEEDFLPCALLCAMSPDAPEEALKAQAIAIYTTCSRMRLQNKHESSDFSCDTAAGHVYAPPEILAKQYGEDFAETFSYIQSLCAEVSMLGLYYEGELITAPYFPLSNGCTQSYTDVWEGVSLPYLQAVACPIDRLHSDLISVSRFSPKEIRAAFPTVTFSEEPMNWFSEITRNTSGYVSRAKLCSAVLTGTQIRETLSLRSAAFTIEYTDENFLFTVYGTGHGVGMSQSAAVYMAEHGASHTDILSYFYPGTTLQKIEACSIPQAELKQSEPVRHQDPG